MGARNKKFFKFSRGSVDAWGQQLTNFMTFVVVLMCEGI
jgi:hypothetical protein